MYVYSNPSGRYYLHPCARTPGVVGGLVRPHSRQACGGLSVPKAHALPGPACQSRVCVRSNCFFNDQNYISIHIIILMFYTPQLHDESCSLKGTVFLKLLIVMHTIYCLIYRNISQSLSHPHMFYTPQLHDKSCRWRSRQQPGWRTRAWPSLSAWSRSRTRPRCVSFLFFLMHIVLFIYCF